MSWVRIDDHFYDHPKWADAPGDSIALWLAAMAWCNRNDSHDGFIPSNKLLGLVNIRNVKTSTADLCGRNAFHQGDGGYWIHDYPEYQQNEKVKKIREDRRAAGKKGAAARWGEHGVANMANGVANGWQVPWQPDGNENAPPPTTHHPVVSKSSNIHTPLTGDEGVDNSDLLERLNEIVNLYAIKALAEAKTKRKVTDDVGYKRRARETAQAHEKLVFYATTWPDAPADVIAACLHGDTHSLAFYQRFELDNVRPLRPGAASR